MIYIHHCPMGGINLSPAEKFNTARMIDFFRIICSMPFTIDP